MVLNWETAKTIAKHTEPKMTETLFVARVAAESLICGQMGRIKSSSTISGTAFRLLESELIKWNPSLEEQKRKKKRKEKEIRLPLHWLSIRMSSKFGQLIHLRDALKTPATKSPGRPRNVPTVSMTNNGKIWSALVIVCGNRNTPRSVPFRSIGEAGSPHQWVIMPLMIRQWIVTTNEFWR